MPRWILKILFIIGIFFIQLNSQGLKADHVMGADMSYKCLGNDKYKIIIKFYRDCRGASAPPTVVADPDRKRECWTTIKRFFEM